MEQSTRQRDLEQLASEAGAYRSALLKSGITPELADQLVRDWQSSLLQVRRPDDFIHPVLSPYTQDARENQPSPQPVVVWDETQNTAVYSGEISGG